jgi:hypothetical protein
MIHDNGAAICAAVKADLDNGGFAVQMTDVSVDKQGVGKFAYDIYSARPDHQ